MNRDYVHNENLNSIVLFAILFLISSFLVYLGVINSVGLLTDELLSYEVELPKIILYFLPSVYLMFYFKNLYYKRITKNGRLVFSIITTLFIALSVYLMIKNYKYFLNNYLSGYFNAYTPWDLIIIIQILLFINIDLFVDAFDKKVDKYLDPLNPGVFNVYTHKRLVFILIMGTFSLFYLASFFKGLIIFSNFNYYPFEYAMLLIYIVLPFINLVFYLNLNLKNKKTVISYGILGIFDCLFLISFVLLFYLDDAMLNARVGQNILVGSFAVTVPITFYLILIILVTFIVNIIINFKKFNNSQK